MNDEMEDLFRYLGDKGYSREGLNEFVDVCRRRLAGGETPYQIEEGLRSWGMSAVRACDFRRLAEIVREE